MRHNVKKNLSNEVIKINPNYIVGFIDAEGSFNITIYKDSNRPLKN